VGPKEEEEAGDWKNIPAEELHNIYWLNLTAMKQRKN
jgi:hypothetical protein